MAKQKQLQTIQLEKTLIDGIKQTAKMNGRSLTGEVTYVMTQHITANITKVEQHTALDNVAKAGNLKSNDK